MATEYITNIKLTLKADKKTYYTCSNIYDDASDQDLYLFAQQVSGLQNKAMEKVIKTTEYRLIA